MKRVEKNAEIIPNGHPQIRIEIDSKDPQEILICRLWWSLTPAGNFRYSAKAISRYIYKKHDYGIKITQIAESKSNAFLVDSECEQCHSTEPQPVRFRNDASMKLKQEKLCPDCSFKEERRIHEKFWKEISGYYTYVPDLPLKGFDYLVAVEVSPYEGETQQDAHNLVDGSRWMMDEVKGNLLKELAGESQQLLLKESPEMICSIWLRAVGEPAAKFFTGMESVFSVVFDKSWEESMVQLEEYFTGISKHAKGIIPVAVVGWIWETEVEEVVTKLSKIEQILAIPIKRYCIE